MAVQTLSEMPDAEDHHGDPVEELLRALNAPRSPGFLRRHLTGRFGFMMITVGLHVAAVLALIRMQYVEHPTSAPDPVTVSLIEPPSPQPETPPQYTPSANVTYALPAPPEMSFETETITTEAPTAAIADGNSNAAGPPMVGSVEYLRAAPPVYPEESLRTHEHGTVILRVVVDALGRPSKIQVERSSGYERLDTAAREAVEKFLFRPYEVNGVAQPAQVLIPIGFDRRGA
jgi:protein TonB